MRERFAAYRDAGASHIVVVPVAAERAGERGDPAAKLWDWKLLEALAPA